MAHLVTLSEKRDMISRYPKETIKVESWFPNWESEYECSKSYILNAVEYLIFLQSSRETIGQYCEYYRQYGDLINKAYEVVKEEMGN